MSPLETETGVRFWGRRIMKFQDSNPVTSDPEADGLAPLSVSEAVMQSPDTDDSVGSSTALLSTSFSLLFLALVLVLALAVRRCCCGVSGKDGKILPQRLESCSDKKKIPLNKCQYDVTRSACLRRISSYRGSLDSILRTLTPRTSTGTQPPTGRKFYQGSCDWQHQQLKTATPLSSSLPDLFSRGGLIGIVDPEVRSRNIQARIFFCVTFKPIPFDEVNVYVDRVEYILPEECVGMERGEETFVCVYLLPDEMNYGKTKSVLSASTSLVFDELLRFKVARPRSSLSSSSSSFPTHLRLSVYELDQRRLRHTVGHVIIPLNDKEIESNDVMICRDLESDDVLELYASLGDILVTLTYDPDDSKVNVKVVEARGLKALGKDTEFYACAQVMFGEQQMVFKRTACRKFSSNFRCNDCFQLPLPVMHLDSTSIRLSIVTFDPLGAPSEEGGEVYGSTLLGPYRYAREEELNHWMLAVTRPYEAFARWHKLTGPRGIQMSRDSVDATVSSDNPIAAFDP